MRKLPVYLLLDTSGSMRGEPIASLNHGVQTLITLLFQDPQALETVYLSVITFDDAAKQIVPLTDLINFRCPTLTVDKGLTSMGQALALVAERIEKEVSQSSPTIKGDWKPLVFLMTDGEPTDDYQAGLARFKKVNAGTVVACACGPDCDTVVLKEITPNVIATDKLDKSTLESVFKWVSASVGVTSQRVEAGKGEPALAGLPELPTGVHVVDKPRRPTVAGPAGGSSGPYNRAGAAQRAANKDRYGNPDGPQFDLARDGAFKGLKIGVLDLGNFAFGAAPAAALAEKGFTVQRWPGAAPVPAELARALQTCCQLWILSTSSPILNHGHVDVIRAFFDSGRGVYIWGDNDPFFVDANLVGKALLGVTMYGDVPGGQVVPIRTPGSRAGLVAEHAISTGLENIFEGATIATIQENAVLQPVVYGSAGNLVVAAYDRDGKRAILDGGFTRLYVNWDTAGTGRYVKNAACWLVNYERFGAAVLKGS